MYYKLEHMIYKYNSNLSNLSNCFYLGLLLYASDFSIWTSGYLRVVFSQYLDCGATVFTDVSLK